MFIRSPSQYAKVFANVRKCSRMLRQCTIMSHIPQKAGECIVISLTQAKNFVGIVLNDTKSRVLLYNN